jgi:hypothetical protein
MARREKEAAMTVMIVLFIMVLGLIGVLTWDLTR